MGNVIKHWDSVNKNWEVIDTRHTDTRYWEFKDEMEMNRFLQEYLDEDVQEWYDSQSNSEGSEVELISLEDIREQEEATEEAVLSWTD